MQDIENTDTCRKHKIIGWEGFSIFGMSFFLKSSYQFPQGSVFINLPSKHHSEYVEIFFEKFLLPFSHLPTPCIK